MVRKAASVLLWFGVAAILTGFVLLGFQWFLPASPPAIRFVGTRSTTYGKELIFETTNESSSPWTYVGTIGSREPLCFIRFDGNNAVTIPAGTGPSGYDRMDLAPRSSIRWSIPLPATTVRHVQIGTTCFRGSAREFRLLQLFRPQINRPLRFFDGRQVVLLQCTVDENGLQAHLP